MYRYMYRLGDRHWVFAHYQIEDTKVMPKVRKTLKTIKLEQILIALCETLIFGFKFSAKNFKFSHLTKKCNVKGHSFS